jgi:hypothetical protein
MDRPLCLHIITRVIEAFGPVIHNCFSSSVEEIRAQCLLHLDCFLKVPQCYAVAVCVHCCLCGAGTGEGEYLVHPRMLSTTACLWIARNVLLSQYSAQTSHLAISTFVDYWRSTLKDNTLDMMIRWKPRCNGWSKHWALISSPQESNIWDMAGTCSREIMWRVCVLFLLFRTSVLK